MKQKQKPKHVTRQIDWDCQKHDDLMRSIQEVLNGKAVSPLTGSKLPKGDSDHE